MRRWWIFPGVLALAACGEASSPPEPVLPSTPNVRGESLFRAEVGALSCAGCHSTTHEDQPDAAVRRVGHSVADATRRPSWWYGTLEAAKGATALDAALTCVARFQHRTWNTTLPVLPDGRKDLSKVEMPAEDRAALAAHLESLARPGPHPAIPAAKDGSRAALVRVEALPGDAARGRGVWDRSCAACHGQGSVGPSLRGSTAPDRFRVIDYVRNGPTKTDMQAYDCWMPFYTPDVLPDQDLADVATLIDEGAW